MLEIYNSLSRQKEVFKSMEPGKVGLYVCGITVYDFCHIGHARMFLSFDMIVRYLKYSGYTVNFIRNITDVDDKIIDRAAKKQEPYQALAQRYIDFMHEDCRQLGLLAPNLEPRATEYMQAMIDLISDLIAKGYAYVGKNQDVYYSVRKFKAYGALSGQTLDDLISGSRVEVESAKQDPLDFVLWKQAKAGEPYWDSPWGRGRPGWHIECSAMSLANLGQTFDIHGGGPDLKFPHHENERCQSEASTGCQFVHYWMHTGFLNINNDKMSKSLDNFVTIKQALEAFHPEVLRYFMLQAHYRGPLDYSKEQLENAKQGLSRLYIALADLELSEQEQQGIKNTKTGYTEAFNQAMDDDFNTPKALAVLFEMARELNKNGDLTLAKELRALGQVLGFFQDSYAGFMHYGLKSQDSDLTIAKIEALILERNQARADKNWKKSDEIRNQLLKEGIVLEDSTQKTTWKKI